MAQPRELSPSPPPASDYLPIMLEGGGGGFGGPLPFKFENMWLKDERFKDLINFWLTNVVFLFAQV